VTGCTFFNHVLTPIVPLAGFVVQPPGLYCVPIVTLPLVGEYIVFGLHVFRWFLLFMAIGNSGNGNQKRKIEMKNGNSQNLMQMNAKIKPMINNNLLKITSVQRPLKTT